MNNVCTLARALGGQMRGGVQDRPHGDRQTKEPFNTRADKIAGRPLVVDKVASEIMKRGVVAQAWLSHFVIAPPLIVSKEEIDLGVEALDATLGIADQQVV